MKKIISLIVLIAWMSFIFLMSNKNGQASGNLSSLFIRNVVVTVTNIKDESKIEYIVQKSSFFVRKTAHFFEYFVLALLTINFLTNFGFNKHLFLYATIFCIIYAITDEVHQLFISGRSGQISDVLLDSLASILSSYIFSKLYLRGGYEKKNN